MPVEHQAHAAPRLVAGDVLAELGAGGDALDDRTHQGAVLGAGGLPSEEVLHRQSRSVFVSLPVMASLTPRRSRTKIDAVLDPDLVAPQRLLGRFIQGCPVSEVERGPVQRAPDDRAGQHPARQRRILVGAGVVGGEDFAAGVRDQQIASANPHASHRAGREFVESAGSLEHVHECLTR